MNKYASYPHRIPGGFGYWAMIRLCRDAKPAPIMDADDKPKVFQTKGEAAEECLRHIISYMNGRPIRGEVFEGADYSTRALARSQAERVFQKDDAA